MTVTLLPRTDAITAGSRGACKRCARDQQEEMESSRKVVGFYPRKWSAFIVDVFVIVAETESKPGLHINYSFIRKEIKQSRRENKI